jgi:tetratricopeptide (TPR) repeat protein
MIIYDATDLHHAARVALLRAAQAWEEQGMLHSAIDAYSRLLKRHPGSVESQAAFERLMAMGSLFAEQGHFHEALSLFDKVEKLT